MTKSITIFIDESGTLPDPKDPYVVMVAAATTKPENLLQVTKITRKFLGNPSLSEIKFYRSGQRTKIKFLQALAKQDETDLFAIVINKQKKSIPDTPQNFAQLAWLLLQECQIFYQNRLIKEIVFDRHFHKIQDQELFNQTLKQLLSSTIPIFHQDSQQMPQINVSDMVAGSVLWSISNKDQQYRKIIQQKLVSMTEVNWTDLHTRFWHKKNRSNRRKRPSESI